MSDRAIRNTIFLAGAAIVLAGTDAANAASGYITNSAQWQKLSVAEKAAYAEGLNDTVNFVYNDDNLLTGIVKAARTRCLLQTKTTPNLLSDIITSGYDKAPGLRSQPPLVVYISRLTEICRPIINEERARFGLPPQ